MLYKMQMLCLVWHCLNASNLHIIFHLSMLATTCVGCVQHMVIVEGLILDELKAGMYMLNCLPLKLQGSDGAPIRCIATNR